MSEPNVRNWRAASADRALNNEAEFASQLPQVRLFNDLWQDELSVLPGQAVDCDVDDKPNNDGIDEEKPMPENKSGSNSGYSTPTYGDVRHLIREALEEQDKRRLGILVDDKCKNVITVFFEEPHERAKRFVYTPVFEVIKQAAAKAFFTGGADWLLDDKIYKPTESHDFTQGLVCHLIK